MVKVNIFARYNHRWLYFLLVRRLTCPPTVNTLVKNSLFGRFVVLHVKCSTSYPVPSISVERCRQHTIALMPVSNELWDAAMGAGWTCYRKRRRGFGMMSSDLSERCDCQDKFHIYFLLHFWAEAHKITHYCYDEKLCSIILYLEGCSIGGHISVTHTTFVNPGIVYLIVFGTEMRTEFESIY